MENAIVYDPVLLHEKTGTMIYTRDYSRGEDLSVFQLWFVTEDGQKFLIKEYHK